MKVYSISKRILSLHFRSVIVSGADVLTLSSIFAYPTPSFSWFSVHFRLVCLSIAPHQELRFILPLIITFVLLGSEWSSLLTFLYFKKLFYSSSSPLTDRIMSSSFRLFLWLSLNLIFAIFFVFVLQGGVVPSLFAITARSDISNDSDVIFWHTLHSFSLLSRFFLLLLCICFTDTFISKSHVVVTLRLRTYSSLPNSNPKQTCMTP